MAASTVDVNVPRFNQGVVAVLTAIAYLVQSPALVAVTFTVLAISAVGGPAAAPFTQLYTGAIRPRLQPEGPTEFEAAAPPRFAQTVGAVVLGIALVSLLAGWTATGWLLTLLVTALAALAATTRICVGCILYERVVARDPGGAR